MQKKQILNKTIKKGDFAAGGEVSSKLKNLLRKLGLDSFVVRRVSIISYELEMNIIIHSEGGLIKASVSSSEVIIQAEDDGPGIKDLSKAFQPGFSTASDEIRELGFGAGMGLNNVKNYSDKLDADTNYGEGTRIEAVVFFNN